MGTLKEEKALRRLVADLAQARAEDVEAVLDELAADHQRTVRELLDVYQGRPAPRTGNGKAEDQISLRGFSPAIAERLQAHSGAGSATWRMTEAAAEALRACARDVSPPTMIAPPALEKTAGRWSWLSGRGVHRRGSLR